MRNNNNLQHWMNSAKKLKTKLFWHIILCFEIKVTSSFLVINHWTYLKLCITLHRAKKYGNHRNIKTPRVIEKKLKTDWNGSKNTNNVKKLMICKNFILCKPGECNVHFFLFKPTVLQSLEETAMTLDIIIVFSKKDIKKWDFFLFSWLNAEEEFFCNLIKWFLQMILNFRQMWFQTQ